MFALLASDAITPFFQTVLSFPTVIYSGLLVIVLVYWLSMAMGLVDMDMLDVDTPDADAGVLGGLLLKLGLNHVPVTLVITFIALIGWVLSFFASFYLFPLLSAQFAKLLVALLIMPASALAAAWATAFLIRPLRPLFQTMNREVRVDLIGQTATVRTGDVTPEFGEACIDDGGAGLIVRVRSFDGQGFKRGDKVVILEKIDGQSGYRVMAEAEFTKE